MKLLRVLDPATFRHVGGTAETRGDVQMLTATNRDVSFMLRKGLFREDPGPGNVRELLHLGEAAIVSCEGTCMLPEHLPEAFRKSRVEGASSFSCNGASLPTLEQAERELIGLSNNILT
jgi:DNA-binding NtrC family response regulator